MLHFHTWGFANQAIPQILSVQLCVCTSSFLVMRMCCRSVGSTLLTHCIGVSSLFAVRSGVWFYEILSFCWFCCCCAGSSSQHAGYSLVVVLRLLIVVASWARALERGLQKLKHTGLVVPWCSDPRMKEQVKPRRVLECRKKPDPYLLSLPYAVTINRFHVLLISVTCLPSYLIGEGICPTLPQPSICASCNQQTTHKIPIPLHVPWI